MLSGYSQFNNYNQFPSATHMDRMSSEMAKARGRGGWWREETVRERTLGFCPVREESLVGQEGTGQVGEGYLKREKSNRVHRLRSRERELDPPGRVWGPSLEEVDVPGSGPQLSMSATTWASGKDTGSESASQGQRRG